MTSSTPISSQHEADDDDEFPNLPVGVEFIDENGGGPGVRLRKSAKEKSRK